MSLNYTKHEIVHLKGHKEFTERWVQNIIVKDTSILGLGNLIVRDVERRQHKAGRLDLLLVEEDDNNSFYEVEIQLGATDESHIIRTIEYWERERRLRPDSEHHAVIIAEDITSRFLNVISLFNGSIPLLALQMQAVKIEDKIALVFTRVVDILPKIKDEEVYTPVNRKYWEENFQNSLEIADKLLPTLKSIDEEVGLKYNKYYIGVEKDGLPLNFITISPRKKAANINIKLPKSELFDHLIEESKITSLKYDNYYGRYVIKLEEAEATTKAKPIRSLFKQAYENYLNS